MTTEVIESPGEQRGRSRMLVLASCGLVGLVCVGAAVWAALPESAASCAKRAVAEELRDPYSARFEDVDVYSNESGAKVFGYVNAKNGFGAYSGRRIFTVELDGNCSPTKVYVAEITEAELPQ